MTAVVAAFDVDNTLTTRDCVVPFMRRIAGGSGLIGAVLTEAPWLIGAALRRDRDRVKAHMARRVFGGKLVAAVESEGATFAAMIHREWMRPDTLARLAWHQRSGHRTVLVSASFGPYLRPLGSVLGVDAVMCTELAVDARLTHAATGSPRHDGGLDGANCRAAEKASRLSSWLAGHDLSEAELWAYGDSAGDDAMLAMATHACRIGKLPITEVPDGYDR